MSKFIDEMARLTETESFDCWIDGEPVAKQRPRGATFYTPEKTRKYEAHVASVMQETFSSAVTYPVDVVLDFALPIPKSTTVYNRLMIDLGVKYPSKRDLDNYVKAVLDGANGIAFMDDSQVAALRASVRYTIGEPGVRFSMWRIGLSPAELEYMEYVLRDEVKKGIPVEYRGKKIRKIGKRPLVIT